jgi:proline racemase
MRSDRLFTTIDFHTAGIGMRLLTAGLGRLPGDSIAARRRHLAEHLDHVRTGLCLEPRGHRSMLIAVMTEPVTPGADFGLFFMYPGGYYVSCGEATIGAATVAVETGLVPRRGDLTPVVIDTEMGPVETAARLEDGRVRDVTLKWTPAFVAQPAQVVKVEGVGGCRWTSRSAPATSSPSWRRRPSGWRSAASGWGRSPPAAWPCAGRSPSTWR